MSPHLNQKKFIHTLILVIYCTSFVQPLAWVPSAQADMLGSADTSSTNLTSTITGNTQTKEAGLASCDETCADIEFVMNDKGEKKIGGLKTGGEDHAWSTADDLLCSMLESPTANTGSVNTTIDPRYSASGKTCELTITKEVLQGTYGEYGKGNPAPATGKEDKAYADDAGFQDVCKNAKKLRTHCKYHNSQLELQCLAFGSMRKGSQAQKANNQLQWLDFGCALTCGAACAAANPIGDAICGAAALAEGVAEIQQSIATQDTLLGQLAGEIGGGVGAVGGAAGGGTGAKASYDQRQARLAATEIIEESPTQPGVFNKYTITEEGKKLAGTVSEDDYKKAQASKTGAKDPQRSKISCAMAGLYATLFGVRVYVGINFEENVKKTCDNIQDLASKANAALADLPPKNNPTGSRTGGFDTGKAGSPSAQQEAAMAAACAAGSCTDSSAVQSSKAEAGAMKEIPPQELQKHLPNNFETPVERAKSGDSGGAMASGAAGLGGLGEQLGAMAAEGTKNAAALMGLAGIEMPAMPAGYAGGGHGGRSYASSEGGMFSGNQHGSAAGKPEAIQQFGKPGTSKAGGIFHEGTDLNLFQIVSEKINKKAENLILSKLKITY